MTQSIKRFLPKKWKTIFALLLALIALTFNLFWVWGVFCLFWSWQNFRAKEAYFVEKIERRESPVLYWIIVLSWLGMGILYFYSDVHIQQIFTL